MNKIVNLNQYKDNTKKEEQKIENIIQYLQIKLLEELYYKTDIEIKKLFAKFEDLPGINFIMGLGGKENLNRYFYNVYIDKLFKQAIMSDRDDEEIESVIYDIRSDILNNLIIKYLPSKSYLIDDVKFNVRFFKECSVNQLLLSDKKEIIDFFRYRNEKIKFTESKFEEKRIKNKKNEECNDIDDEVLGKIQFLEDKQIYYCDYFGDYNNFTIKIMINDEEEMKKYTPYIKKVVESLNKPEKDKNTDEAESNYKGNEINQELSHKQGEAEDFIEKVNELSRNQLNLTTVHIWPNKEAYLVYTRMVNDDKNKGIEIGVFDCEK